MLKQKENISIKGHRGTWYVISELQGLYLLESEQYGENAPSIIIDEFFNIILDNVHNGWGDYDEFVENISENAVAINSNATKLNELMEQGIIVTNGAKSLFKYTAFDGNEVEVFTNKDLGIYFTVVTDKEIGLASCNALCIAEREIINNEIAMKMIKDNGLTDYVLRI